MKKYKIIYADPAWKYNDKREKHPRMCGGATRHYQVMDYKDIANLKVSEIADEDCILFMWATFPMLKEAMYVIEKWGFKYKTLGFIWVKTNKRAETNQARLFMEDNFDKFFGIGYYTKSNSEPCFIATKGHPKVLDNTISQVIYKERMEHSKKPLEVKENIIKLMGDLPRIELFAREKTHGFDVWGNELNSDIKL